MCSWENLEKLSVWFKREGRAWVLVVYRECENEIRGKWEREHLLPSFGHVHHIFLMAMWRHQDPIIFILRVLLHMSPHYNPEMMALGSQPYGLCCALEIIPRIWSTPSDFHQTATRAPEYFSLFLTDGPTALDPSNFFGYSFLIYFYSPVDFFLIFIFFHIGP